MGISRRQPVAGRWDRGGAAWRLAGGEINRQGVQFEWLSSLKAF
jgi:hypothetical protein